MAASSSSSTAPVELFSTSILSNHKVRSRHERYLSILTVKKIPFVYHDLASDEEAKSRWRRKARDPQIPGLLVHNEWRGTFDEFEEAVEFGELDLFLRIEAEGSQRAEAVATTAPDSTQPPPPTLAESSSSIQQSESKTDARATSHSVKLLDRLAQPRAPSMNNLAPALPFAPSGSGFRKEHDAESFLASLGISDLNLTEEELNEILEEGKDAKGRQGSTNALEGEVGKIPASSSGERGNGKYPSGLGLGTSKPVVARTYIPSAEAGIKPLRLARMGDGSQKASSSTSPLRTAPSARFNASHLSSKALAAEAQASISSRSYSSIKLREAVSKGDKLEDAFKTTRDADKEHVVGRESLDDLMASLGLNDVKMSEEEAEAFLMDGTIPTGLDTHGERLGRAGSVAERARNEAAARDVARRAKEKGYGSESSRPTSVASSSDLPDLLEEPKGAIEAKEEKEIEEEVPEKEVADVASVLGESHVQTGEKGDDIAAMEEATYEDAEDSKGVVEEPSAEETPVQRSVDLPTLSSDSDQTKGKSSTSSAATILKVEVEAPSDDLDQKMEGEKEVSVEDPPSDVEKVDTSIADDSEVGKSAEPLKDSSEFAGSETIAAGQAVPSQAADEPAAIINLGPGATEVLQQTKADKLPVEETVSLPAKDAPLPELPAPTALDELPPPPPAKSLSPPLSPTPISPSVERATLSPMSISTSPTPSRRSPDDAALTPRRRAMDLPRSMSSSSSLSEATSPLSTSTHAAVSSPINSDGLKSPKSIKSPKISPRNGTKKFFGLGRRKDKDRGKKAEDGSDSEEEAISTAVSSSSPPSNPAGNTARSQKTLSMILREADEALNGISDDEDGLGISHDDEGAFSLELDDVDGEGGLGIEA